VPPAVAFVLNGSPVEVAAPGISLLEALRDHLGVRSAKDGCAPQGQCGCCTVLVDGQPRVACVTPVARVAGRAVTTAEGMEPEGMAEWARAFAAVGATQCGFCTPGIIVRLEALRLRGVPAGDRAPVDQALLAHLCRCTGWQTIHEAYDARLAGLGRPGAAGERDLGPAAARATIEGHTPQSVGGHVAVGGGGFADDTAPPDALVAVRTAGGEWVVADTLTEARALAGRVQGRRTTEALRWPVPLPEGSWDRTLQTTWVEPAYLEPDASWCRPGGEPATPLANGGAFGGKAHSEVAAVARRLADEHGRPVRVLWSREDVVRLGPKRPPLAAGLRRDGTGVVRLARTAGSHQEVAEVARRIGASWPALAVEMVDVAGPPVSAALRGAGWAEVAVLHASLADPPDRVVTPEGAEAEAEVRADEVRVRVRAGAPLDEVVVRSYAIGATHQALGWVRTEGIAVGDDGVPLDLTIRSFGILRAVDMPRVTVEVLPDHRPPVPAGDAVFAAVAAAAWRVLGHPLRWPAQR
jgi:xanthine dehydrogenase small subunit